MLSRATRAPRRCHYIRPLASVRTHTRHAVHDLQAIRTRNEDCNAFVHLVSELPRQQSGPLAQHTVGVKDNICTSDMPTTCSSSMLEGFTSPIDATVVRKLREAGAAIVGKTNCDEFGMGSMNIHSVHGPVRNPFVPDGSHSAQTSGPRSAGGSSGGSAAAVAAGLCDIALGTDTGGSIRLPASYCGVYGFKPSYGIISRWGVTSYADSLDCVGVLARDMGTVSSAFDVISGYDSKDPTAARPNARKAAKKASEGIMTKLKGPLNGLRLGIPQEYFPDEMSQAHLTPFKSFVARLQASGAEIVPVSLPATQYALSAYYVIASAEANSCLARYDGIQYGRRDELPPGMDRRKTADVYAYTRTRGFGDEVKRRILLGAHALTADAFDNYFLKAQILRQRVKADFDRVFATPNVLAASPATPNGSQVDFLIHPSAIRTAPPLPSSVGTDEKAEAASGLDAYTQDVLTVPASLAGLPALSIPVGVAKDGWPMGATIVGQWGSDDTVLAVGRNLEAL